MKNKFKSAGARAVTSCPTLSYGSAGIAVSGLQELLKSKGFDPGPVDGKFGPKTQSAVIAFQQSKGLIQDGIVGPATWAALGINCGGPPPTVKCPTLSYGSSGLAVQGLQELLKAQGFDPGPIDGKFGPKTQSAVIAFQQSKGLVQDGIVGIRTWTALGVNCMKP